MDFEFYRNFIVVAQTGNLTAAANKLALAQPALTAQIKTLEKHYGVKLIESGRGRRNLQLTEAGVDFLTYAQRICEAETVAGLEMASYRQQSGGILRFGVSFNVVGIFMEKFLNPFAILHQKVNFHLKEMNTVEQIESVKKGIIDFGYANAPMPDVPVFSCYKIKQERFFAVYAVKNKLGFCPGKTVSLDEFKGIPLCCNYGALPLLRKLCQNAGFIPRICFVADNGSDTVSFAQMGNCIAVISDNCSSLLPRGMKRTLVDNAELTYAQTLFWCNTRRMSAIVQEFIQFSNDVMQ